MAFGHDNLVRDADRAASVGDLARARMLLESAVREPFVAVDTHLRLAAIRRADGDPAGALAAADAALGVEPLHFMALLLRASLLDRIGAPDAGEAYGRALAQRPDGPLPAHLDATIRHAETASAAHRAATLVRLRAAAEAVMPAISGDRAARVSRFLTNTTRATRVYHSEPSDYHYPGLAEREFHDRDGFEWLSMVEDASETIASELAVVMQAERSQTVPYVQYPEGQPLRQWEALNHSPDWSAIHLIRNGAVVEANSRHCPQTMALLEKLPQPAIAGASPNAMFSLLAPGARIPPHTGVANTRLVCHLPLIVPGSCWFRVGAERRDWERGIAWVFDDTIEHEAANESDAVRVVLIFDIWHPDLDEQECVAIAAIVAAHGGQAAASL